MNENKSFFKGCLTAYISIGMVLIILLLVVAIILGSVLYKLRYEKKLIITSTSPDEKYELKISQIGEPFFFGSTSCRFELFRNNWKISKRNFSISNDGAAIRKTNFQIIWNTNGAQIIVSGCEQEDITYNLNFDGTTS